MTRATVCAGLAALALLTGACTSSDTDPTARTDSPVSVSSPTSPSTSTTTQPTAPVTDKPSDTKPAPEPLPAPAGNTPTATPAPVVQQPEARPQLPLPVPTPTVEQEQALLAGLLRIEPGFATSGADALVAQARKQCAQMMSASPLPRGTLVNNAVIRFTSPSLGPISQAQGAAVVDLIASTFCR